jgi:putative phosphoribosyl transferase
LDVIVVRKLGVPYQPELAMGAIGEGEVRVENEDVMRIAGVGPAELAAVEGRERAELERRAKEYRGQRVRLDLDGVCAIVVDDGIATGSTVRAACAVARAAGAGSVVVAVPVASRLAVSALKDACDAIICVDVPEPFFAVGEWYRDFTQTTDKEVTALLRESAEARSSEGRANEHGGRDVDVNSGEGLLPGRLTVPTGVIGSVVFAHGSGSGRHSPRNRSVARVLNGAGLATMLVDLLRDDEEWSRHSVFDVQLLARRLRSVTRWTAERPELAGLPIAYFGASTGAAAALWAAADAAEANAHAVAAVVSRGGRPELALARLSAVRAPTLFLVGEHDEVVLEQNRVAQSAMRCPTQLVVVPGATHLFGEPGTLQAVATLARDFIVAELTQRT